MVLANKITEVKTHSMLGSTKTVSANSFASDDRIILKKNQRKYFGEIIILLPFCFRTDFLLRHVCLKAWPNFSLWMSC